MANFSPYETIKPYLGQLPTWLGEEDGQRVLSYDAYEAIYWNVPETFRVVFRGSEDSPIYLPSGRQIVNTMNRYLGKDFGFKVDPEGGSPAEQLIAIQAVSALFKRERFLSKFTMNKRYGIIRGDWCWHITANPEKPEGSRISITPLDPGKYFPLVDEDNVDRILGADIVEPIEVGGQNYIKRQRYLRSEHPERGEVLGGPISVQIDILEVADWQDPEKRRFKESIMPITDLSPDIPAIPIYHIKNFEEPQNVFGSSEIRGLERIIAAVNQATSDEEIALAMDGLGMYATDSGSPVDENGDETEWNLGPGKVVEIGSGRMFNRVDGVGSVNPSQDHIRFMIEQLRQSAPMPDVAIGKVDVAVAESGVSLALQMAPILDAAAEKDLTLVDVMDQFFYDLRAWLKVYESTNIDNVGLLSSIGDKLPLNRKERMAELQDLYVNGIISRAYYTDALQKEFGFVFPADMEAQIQSEQAAADPYADRLGEEAAAEASPVGDGGVQE